MRKTLKGLMTTVLTLAMMIGVFAVGGVQVKAAPTYELVAVGEDVTYDEAKALVSDNPPSQAEWEADSEYIPIIRELIRDAGLSSGKLVVFYNISAYNSINSAVWESESSSWTIMSGEPQYNAMKGSMGYVYYYLVINETDSESAPAHEHSYSWVTVREVTTEWDGIEEYRCSCGDVRERRTIPQATIYVSGLVETIQKVPENGDASFESGWYHTMTDYIVEKLAQRSDATFVITFEYKEVLYKMTIPSGVDYSALLADEEYFYGYFYFAQLIGATIEILE